MKHQRGCAKLQLPTLPTELIGVQSGSEYACAKMLERYCDWRPIDGTTMQIKVGRALFDFRIHDTFVEYHPISLRREFLTDGISSISSAIHELDKSKKMEVFKAISDELEAQYAKRRGQVLSVHLTYKEMPLICVHTAEDFIRKVICKFATGKCGDLDSLMREFNKLRNDFSSFR